MNVLKTKTVRYFHSLQVFEFFNFVELFLNVAFVFNFDLDLLGHCTVNVVRAFCQGFNHIVAQFGPLQQLIQIGAALNRLGAAAQ